MFEFQAQIVDHSIQNPFSGWDPSTDIENNEISKLSLIQVFGRSKDGKTICLHVHQYHPTVYAACAEFTTLEEIQTWSAYIVNDLNVNLNEGNRMETCFIISYQLVRGRYFYHYSALERPFLQIKLTFAHTIKKAADFLRQQCCEVFEAHIPFDLQFMINSNVFGMDYIRISQLRERINGERISQADLEFDCLWENIMNRYDLEAQASIRDNATGLFPRSCIMPSVKSMLANLGFDASTQQAEQRVCESINYASMYSDQMKGQFENIDLSMSFNMAEKASSLPAAFLEPKVKVEEKKQQQQEVANSLSSSTPQVRISQPNLLSSRLSAYFPSNMSDFRPMSLSAKINFQSNILKYKISPPTSEQLRLESLKNGALWLRHPKPFFESNSEAKKYGYPTKSINTLPPFYNNTESEVANVSSNNAVILTLAKCPVTFDEVQICLRNETVSTENQIKFTSKAELSQIEGPTQKGFKFSAAPQSQLCPNDMFIILSVEIFSLNERNMLPDPSKDSIIAIFYSVYNAFDNERIKSACFTSDFRINGGIFCQNEEEVLAKFVDFVLQLNPDMLVGYEIQNYSWGYIENRYQILTGCSLRSIISRINGNRDVHRTGNVDLWSERHNSSFQVYGRICLNVWRIMRSELSLQFHDFEYVALQVLHKVIPKYGTNSLRILLEKDSLQLVAHFRLKTVANIDLLVQTETVTKSSEFARLFGVNFYSVISRGSQFKVESLLLRLAHLENFLLSSPSKKDIVEMRAPEALPLVMEPRSGIYFDPIIVLDFQALYPSIIIAYNYCFSTCLGHALKDFPKQLGAVNVKNSAQYGEALGGLLNEDMITVSPNKIAYVKPEIRQGVLPKMLTELLQGRVIIKSLMNDCDEVMKKIFDARQLGLKYISNVTYGYTSAAFSGRMPNIDVADSIVSTGRLTLEKAVKFIESNEKWSASVVYGDTDSLFVKLAGHSLEDAFRIGKEIAKEVTAINPDPIKLKFEKVYFPCALLAKKRYVGMKFEVPPTSEDIYSEAKYEAKGIETVRRDSCPLVGKVLEKSLKMLFITKNLTKVRIYLQKQFTKVLAGGHANLGDFMFAKEVRLGTYEAEVRLRDGSDSEDDRQVDGNLPPAAAVAILNMKHDPMSTPQYGERVPFIVVSKPKKRLMDCIISPEAFLTEGLLQIDPIYYATKQLIPALSRVFSLISIDVNKWYQELPRPPNKLLLLLSEGNSLDKYVFRAFCICCLQPCRDSRRLCEECFRYKEHSYYVLLKRLMEIEEMASAFKELSQYYCKCTMDPFKELNQQVFCKSVHCPLFWTHVNLRHRDASLYANLKSALTLLEED